MGLAAQFQTALAAVYPPRCLTCGEMVEGDFGLCGPCWRDTAFIGGTVCDCCGLPLPGTSGGEAVQCDACLVSPRPWVQGRAALLYRDTGRRLVLALKHGDRQEIARPAARWMATAVRALITEDTLVAPVPLHWRRLLARRSNQSALLGRALARHLDLAWCPDLLQRRRHTRSLDGLGREERHAVLAGALSLHPKRAHLVPDRPVLLVDDVMTSGATLGEATRVLQAAGSGAVRVVTLARVTKEA